jgi:hypothetical protein
MRHRSGVPSSNRQQVQLSGAPATIDGRDAGNGFDRPGATRFIGLKNAATCLPGSPGDMLKPLHGTLF